MASIFSQLTIELVAAALALLALPIFDPIGGPFAGWPALKFLQQMYALLKDRDEMTES